MHRSCPIVLAAVLLALPGGTEPARSQAAEERRERADSNDIDALIHDLGDQDPAVRHRATQRLIAIGAPAREKILEATQARDPEQRARAAEIIAKLPWYTEEDPPAVRSRLMRYGDESDIIRRGIIAELASIDGGADALFRLLRDEPRNVLRWNITIALLSQRDPDIESKARALDTRRDDPPVLLLSGLAWRERDPARSHELLRRAIDANAKHPTTDGGSLWLAFEELIEAAIASGDFDQAADLLRRQMPRELAARRSDLRLPLSPRRDDSPAFARLMALHNWFGPLRGFEADIQTWAGNRSVPPDPRHGAHALLARFGAAPPVPSGFVQLSPLEHYSAGQFLLGLKLLGAAEIELNAALAAEGKAEAPIGGEDDALRANALFALARVAAGQNDDAAAADHLDRALQLQGTWQLKWNNRDHDPSDEVRAEIHFRRARVAEQRGDAAAADAHVKNLIQLVPGNTDLTLEMIGWLKESSRPDAARTLFDKVYKRGRERLDAAKRRERAGMQNDLAWLCGRAGERLDEALELAQSAVKASAENAAFLDTLAEVHFQRGDIDRAIQTEQKALTFAPGNAFMLEQLQRFEAAGKSSR